MQNIEIVLLKPSEWEIYKTIQLEALKEDPQAFGASYKEWINFSDEKWTERPSNKNSRIFVAKDHSAPIGLVGILLKPEKAIAEMWGMYINNNYRGKGLGKKLINTAVSELKRVSKVAKIQLMVEYSITPAQMLYRSLGFQPIGTTEYILGDGKKHKLYVMEKEL
jgi:ribosomal protein S18 acetylase RimI-like enzyme